MTKETDSTPKHVTIAPNTVVDWFFFKPEDPRLVDGAKRFCRTMNDAQVKKKWEQIRPKLVEVSYSVDTPQTYEPMSYSFTYAEIRFFLVLYYHHKLRQKPVSPLLLRKMFALTCMYACMYLYYVNTGI